jgi:hypothetical protein
MPRYQYLRKSLTWKKKSAEKICFANFFLLLSVREIPPWRYRYRNPLFLSRIIVQDCSSELIKDLIKVLKYVQFINNGWTGSFTPQTLQVKCLFIKKATFLTLSDKKEMLQAAGLVCRPRWCRSCSDWTPANSYLHL